jgi:hypothetical protein
LKQSPSRDERPVVGHPASGLGGTARIDADLKRDFEDEINAMFDLGLEAVTEPG